MEAVYNLLLQWGVHASNISQNLPMILNHHFSYIDQMSSTIGVTWKIMDGIPPNENETSYGNYISNFFSKTAYL